MKPNTRPGFHCLTRSPRELFVALVACSLIIGLNGCSKSGQDTGSTASNIAQVIAPTKLTVLPESSRSKHFMAVNQHLDIGGTVYGFVDIDGDVDKFAVGLKGMLANIAVAQPQLAPFVQQDIGGLFQALGLTDVKAIGVSSYNDDGTGLYQNKAFFYIPGPRHGLLAGLGGASAPFARLGLAPKDTDIYFETEMDLPEVYKTVRAVTVKIGGDTAANQMEDQLRQAGEAMKTSFLYLIEGWKGRTTIVVRLSATETTTIPGREHLTVPTPEFLVRVDGIGPVINATLELYPEFSRVTDPVGAVTYRAKSPSPISGISPVFFADNDGSFYFASTDKFLNECRNPGKVGLAQSPAFKEAISHVESEGNGLTYVSGELFRKLARIEGLNPTLAPADLKSLQSVLGLLPHTVKPLVSVRRNLPDGILIHSYWDRSIKQDVALGLAANPVTVGLIAAMAIPAFEKVRASSQEKAVLNNLRLLAAATDQYCLEHGVNYTTLPEIVGPTKYIKAVTAVGGEDYRTLIFRKGTTLRIYVPLIKKVVEYTP